MKPPMTKMEYVAPRVVKSKEDMPTKDFLLYLFYIIVLIGSAWAIHTFMEPDPVHAATKVLSDKEQEKEYCTQLATGENKVWHSAATQREINEFCNQFL